MPSLAIFSVISYFLRLSHHLIISNIINFHLDFDINLIHPFAICVNQSGIVLEYVF